MALIKKDWFLLVIFCIAAIIQILFTELSNDEAYYWTWSENLHWGYLDHPPFIALIIKLGYLLFKNELGVRLISTILLVISIQIIKHLLCPKNSLLFYGYIFSIVFLSIGGSIAVPDIPLFFFTILFYYFLKGYLQNENMKDGFGIAIVSALLIYSKYHGALLILFTIITNYKLLRSKYFYLIFAVFLIIISPHLYWLYGHNFITVKFHLFERSGINSPTINNLLNFYGGVILLYGIIIFPLFILDFKLIQKFKSKWEITLRNNLIYTIIFLTILCIRGAVEANWIIVAFFPLIYFGYQLIEQRYFSIKSKTVVYAIVLSVSLNLIVKFYIVNDFVPNYFSAKSEYYGWKIWAQEIQYKTGRYPVVFVNSYQKASKFHFYSGNKSYSMSNVKSRRSQYDLENEIDYGLNDSLTFIPNWPIHSFDSIKTNKELYYYTKLEGLTNYNKIWFESESKKFICNQYEKLQLTAHINLYQSFIISEKKFNENLPKISIEIFDLQKQHQTLNTTQKLTLQDIQRQSILIQSEQIFLEPGEYKMYISLVNQWFPPGINSFPYSLKIL